MKKKTAKIMGLVLMGVMTLSMMTYAESSDSEGGVVGVILSDYTKKFFLDIDGGIRDVLEPAGYEVVTLNSSNDAAKDVTNMEDLLTQDPLVIIYNPVDSDAAADVVALANDAEVPVITVDRSVAGGEIACHIASDNVYGGELAGQYIVDALGEEGGHVAEIQGQPGASAANDRGEGFHNIVDPLDNIEVVYSQTGNWSTAEGMTNMENALQQDPEIKAVFCHNDSMALGVIEACQQADRGDIIIVGFDADAEAIDAIKAGTMAATIQQLPANMGTWSGETALKIINGESVEEQIGVEVEVIDASNAE